MNKQHSYPTEGDVVRGQSKVEKAKYVHTENNLRRTLENISESFRRTNKRLSDETETLRLEFLKLRQSVEQIQQEKMKRKTGEYYKRRPYRAERLLGDENVVTLRPFDYSNSKFATQTKSWAKKQNQRRLAPIRLHQNKPKYINNEEEIIIYDKKEQPTTLLEEKKLKKAVPLKLPKIKTFPCTNDEYFTRRKETNIKRISKDNQTSRLQKHMLENKVTPNETQYLEVPTIPVCDFEFKNNRVDIIHSRPHFLAPLDKITEGEVAELKSSFPADDMNLVESDKSLTENDN